MIQLGNQLGVVDKRQNPQTSNADSIATVANYADEAALDARLTAISGTTYSAANLLRMSKNDKVFAVRLNDDAGSF